MNRSDWSSDAALELPRYFIGESMYAPTLTFRSAREADFAAGTHVHDRQAGDRIEGGLPLSGGRYIVTAVLLVEDPADPQITDMTIRRADGSYTPVPARARLEAEQYILTGVRDVLQKNPEALVQVARAERSWDARRAAGARHAVR